MVNPRRRVIYCRICARPWWQPIDGQGGDRVGRTGLLQIDPAITGPACMPVEDWRFLGYASPEAYLVATNPKARSIADAAGCEYPPFEEPRL